MTRTSSNRIYKDYQGRAWEPVPTLAIVQDFADWFYQAAAAGVDALSVLYASALWESCEEQAAEYGIPQEDFLELVTPEFINALWISLEPFSSELAAMSAAYRSA